MFTSIRWRCFMRVSTQQKAEHLVRRMQDLLGSPMEIESYERYWKIPELAEVCVTSPLHQETAAEAFLAALEAAWALARGWSVSNPDGLRHEFEGIAAMTTGAEFTIPGVEWMTFHIVDVGPANVVWSLEGYSKHDETLRTSHPITSEQIVKLRKVITPDRDDPWMINCYRVPVGSWDAIEAILACGPPDPALDYFTGAEAAE
ncbi:hypothetical protein [Streptomyces sp. KLOTTS4A1]|uniref:DUF7683 domain-containing protein n=1 Tax=Streptomyces sp. KLOTTS4A1 TaxID=3390996 RepID=UPI0039F4B485